MSTPHVHAALIKAWADGAEIEWYNPNTDRWVIAKSPGWGSNHKYRLKPQLQPWEKWNKEYEAWKDGATLQYRKTGTDEEWEDWGCKAPNVCVPHNSSMNTQIWEWRIKPHKWQKEMDAWKEGKTIQGRTSNGVWVAFSRDMGEPSWNELYEYRIKPEQTVSYLDVSSLGIVHARLSVAFKGANLKLTFEEDKLVKAEVL